MRIAIVMISNFGESDGGRETWARNFLPKLSRNDVTVDLIGLRQHGQPDHTEDLVALMGSSAGQVRFIETDRRRFQTVAMLREIDSATQSLPPPDIVLAVGSFMELTVVRRAQRFRNAKKIAWLRTIWVDERASRIPRALHELARTIEMQLLKGADLVIANGEDTADHYRKRGLTVTAIPNGVDLSRWTTIAPVMGEPLQVALVGRLIPHKGVAEYLQVAEHFKGDARFQFNLMGSGEQFDARASRADAEGWLAFHGEFLNRELPAKLGQMDVCLNLSFKNADFGGGGVSNALLEQMASGRVIVAWDNGLYKQLLNHTNAYLIEQGNVAALQDCLEYITVHQEEAIERASAARRTAEDYSLERHMQRFASAVDQLLSEA